MLIESLHKKYWFILSWKDLIPQYHTGLRHSTLGVKMADAIISYVSNYKFQFQFSFKIENCKFQ